MMARPDICTNKEKVTYGAQTNCHASTGAYMINANRNHKFAEQALLLNSHNDSICILSFI
jgi:hypothetical protein